MIDTARLYNSIQKQQQIHNVLDEGLGNIPSSSIYFKKV